MAALTDAAADATRLPAAAPDGADARLIAGRGTPEPDWLRAAWLRALPEAAPDALLGDARRLVVVAPHPDDEVLGAGGLMALAAARGLPVRVLALTDGERCYPTLPGAARASLARIRRVELHRALERLGVASGGVEHLRLPDGGLQAAGAALALRIHRLLQPRDLVLTTWRRDGHPDHEAAAAAVADAAGRAGCRRMEFPVWGWHWAHPDGRDLPVADMRRLPLDRPTRARKLWALRAFASQLGRGSAMPAAAEPILPRWVLARFRRDFETFVL
ncbi:PIG-L deacetylase family protein [Luteimonas huabeiensis]|uniref:PIG-L deacetylase family protein n=1 Tax=Luteimonas huabeiensis TaxID=1244513 RepID=UPI0004643F50|nr:PIG-L family deacetylase [Luteimonas huabeiensis]